MRVIEKNDTLYKIRSDYGCFKYSKVEKFAESAAKEISEIKKLTKQFGLFLALSMALLSICVFAIYSWSDPLWLVLVTVGFSLATVFLIIGLSAFLFDLRNGKKDNTKIFFTGDSVIRSDLFVNFTRVKHLSSDSLLNEELVNEYFKNADDETIIGLINDSIKEKELLEAKEKLKNVLDTMDPESILYDETEKRYENVESRYEEVRISVKKRTDAIVEHLANVDRKNREAEVLKVLSETSKLVA